MKRRALLAGVATGTAVLAGCVASGIGDDDGNETTAGDDGSDGDHSGDDSNDGSPSGEEGDPPTIAGSAIETDGSDCASADAGDATAERADGTVTVDGTIAAPNPCHEAVLLDASVKDGRLVLRVDGRASMRSANSVSGQSSTLPVSRSRTLTTSWDRPSSTSTVTSTSSTGGSHRTSRPERSSCGYFPSPAVDTAIHSTCDPATPSCRMPRRGVGVTRTIPAETGRSTRVENHQPARRFRANDNA